VPDNNAMNLPNRGVTVSRSGRPPSVSSVVGRPVILSLGVAGYCSVRRTHVIQQPARIRPAMTTASPVMVFAG
jgi:hypothetical protein